jgi:hypothetical protein
MQAIRNFVRNRLAAYGVLTLVSLTLGTTTAGAAEIVVTWVLVHQEIRPQPGLRHSNGSIRLSLRGGSTIAEGFEFMNMRGQRIGRSLEGQFRNPMAAGLTNVTWRVQNARTLVRTSESFQHTAAIRVTTTGTNSCRATVSYRLKRGFREYRIPRISTGEPVFVSRMHADQIKCTVSP